MNPRLKLILIAILLLTSMWTPVCAQPVQFLPEIDTYFRVNPSLRVYLEAKDRQEDGSDFKSFGIGPSVQFFLKLPRLRESSDLEMDDPKTRPLVLETGFRYITFPNSPPINRMETVLTFQTALIAGFLISDRNGADLDWQNGGFNWRYRNKLTLGRTLATHLYHFSPYVAVEPYYVSKYAKWSTTALYAGCLFPIGKHLRINSYYKHENKTGKSPNQQANAIGLAL